MRCLLAVGLIGLVGPLASAQTFYGPAAPPPVMMQDYPRLDPHRSALLHVLQEPSPRIEVQINGDVMVGRAGHGRGFAMGHNSMMDHRGVCDPVYYRKTDRLTRDRDDDRKVEEPVATQPARQSIPVTNRRGVQNKAKPGEVIIIPMKK